MNSSRVKLTIFAECHAFCKKNSCARAANVVVPLFKCALVYNVLLHDHSYRVVAFLVFARINHSAE